MLRDHFHPPLSEQRHWHAFRNAWATHLADDLNRRLPEGWFAEPNVQFGIEIDVATFEEARTDSAAEGLSGNGPAAWSPPNPTLTLDFPIVTDIVQVDVFSIEAGPVLAGAIELVSPSNKDRPERRDAFVSKCEAYLREGLGLVIVDIVTSRGANLHTALLERVPPASQRSGASDLYAAAYRVVPTDAETSLQVWYEGLVVGGLLPTLPLFLRSGPMVPVVLAETYQTTCFGQRIDSQLS
jgi:hypothetical protein